MLKSLKILHVNNNKLHSLPKSMLELKSLKNIDLTHNYLTEPNKLYAQELSQNGTRVKV